MCVCWCPCECVFVSVCVFICQMLCCIRCNSIMHIRRIGSHETKPTRCTLTPTGPTYAPNTNTKTHAHTHKHARSHTHTPTTKGLYTNVTNAGSVYVRCSAHGVRLLTERALKSFVSVIMREASSLGARARARVLALVRRDHALTHRRSLSLPQFEQKPAH